MTSRSGAATRQVLTGDEDDIYLPGGPLHGGEPRDARLNGINALMAAVLEEAIRNYCHGSALMRADVERWIIGANGSSPFSYRTICEHLGLHPVAVWKAVQRRAPPTKARPTRSRGNVRVTRPLR